MFTSIT